LEHKFSVIECVSATLKNPKKLSFVLPLTERDTPQIAAAILSETGPIDAWELFALRALLLAFVAREEDAVLKLESELARPIWEHVLEQIAQPIASTSVAWSFGIMPLHVATEFVLLPYSRRPTAKGKEGRLKKETFHVLYTDADDGLEREIARMAIAVAHRDEVRLSLGEPRAHELLRLLMKHPDVHWREHPRADAPTQGPVGFVVGELAMVLHASDDGVLRPHFVVGEEPVAEAVLRKANSAAVYGERVGNTIVSTFVPKTLRPWLDTWRTNEGAVAFPAESIPQLLAATQPLITQGRATVPREALGSELPYDPVAGLRVEWHAAGAVVVGICIAVHGLAPFVTPGAGAAVFTFVDGETRYVVERDLEREVRVAEEACTRIEAPLVWEGNVGRTENLHDALDVATYLDSNPLGLRIEVKVGRPPRAVAWEETTRSLDVQRKGAWLAVGGALDVAGVTVTLGEVLDAARLAQRFVRASDNVFLELSKDVIEKLQRVAIATDLGAGGLGKDVLSPRLNAAFGGLLADAQGLFSDVTGVPLVEYATRFEQRDKRARVPALESGTLRDYQRDGVAWMLGLATWAPGCILADDMGLGKTVQTASLLKARSKLGPQLIVAPASVSSNWMMELARFMPSLKALWLYDERDLAMTELGPSDVLVASFGLLQRRRESFDGIRFATVVIDEAQYVKNTSAQRTEAVRSLQRDFTVALTGTPIENHLGELFSIVDLAFPGLLGSEATFRDKFRKVLEGGARDDVRMAVLGKLLTPFLLRRTRASVLQELPPREEITETIDLDPKEQKRYMALRKACEEQFTKRKTTETAPQLKIALLAALTRLRQLACDVRLVDPTYKGPSSKVQRTVALCTEIAGSGNRALVFSQFTQLLLKVKPELEEAGLRVAYLAGETPPEKRRSLVEAFQDGQFDVFCVSLLAGGTGLNLTRASYVIHMDPWWNPAAEEQATSRAHRMGQSDPVTVYRLVSRGTIEEAVLAMHASKKELAAAVLDGKDKTNATSANDLLDLLRFGAP
jgi:superfamily II DNA or RNA helicase